LVSQELNNTELIKLFFLCKNCTCLFDERQINVSVVGCFFIFMKTLDVRFRKETGVPVLIPVSKSDPIPV
jgi:hypothetical protein